MHGVDELVERICSRGATWTLSGPAPANCPVQLSRGMHRRRSSEFKVKSVSQSGRRLHHSQIGQTPTPPPTTSPPTLRSNDVSLPASLGPRFSHSLVIPDPRAQDRGVRANDGRSWFVEREFVGVELVGGRGWVGEVLFYGVSRVNFRGVAVG